MSKSFLAPASYFTEENRSVFIIWKPLCDKCPHKIAILSSNDFEVTCCCPMIDESTIRKQIKYLIMEKARQKKNN